MQKRGVGGDAGCYRRVNGAARGAPWRNVGTFRDRVEALELWPVAVTEPLTINWKRPSANVIVGGPLAAHPYPYPMRFCNSSTPNQRRSSVKMARRLRPNIERCVSRC